MANSCWAVCVQRNTLALEAVERCITLFMVLGNLHWFTPATCPPHLEVSRPSLLPPAPGLFPMLFVLVHRG